MNIFTDMPCEAGPLHRETQERSLRCPSPPRIWIPPPQTDESGLPDIGFVTSDVNRHVDSSFTNTDFIQDINYEELIRRDVGRDWKYEERREAQQVLPFLYLGPDGPARDKNFLTKAGITMCLAVRNTLSARANLLNPKAPRELGIPVVNIDVMGNPQLISEFPKAIAAINEHLNSRYNQFKAKSGTSPSPPGRVLVFCETGNERSAAVAAAYAMAMYSLDVAKAIQLVQSSRFCVALDYHLAHLLRSYDAILMAKRDVYRAVTPVESPPNGSKGNMRFEGLSLQPKKRGFQETRDDDEDMEDAMEAVDSERFANRQPLAPFIDALQVEMDSEMSANI